MGEKRTRADLRVQFSTSVSARSLASQSSTQFSRDFFSGGGPATLARSSVAFQARIAEGSSPSFQTLARPPHCARLQCTLVLAFQPPLAILHARVTSEKQHLPVLAKRPGQRKATRCRKPAAILTRLATNASSFRRFQLGIRAAGSSCMLTPILTFFIFALPSSSGPSFFRCDAINHDPDDSRSIPRSALSFSDERYRTMPPTYLDGCYV